MARKEHRLIELIYGLHSKKCINDGDVLLGDMLTTFMGFLEIEKPLANCYITYRDENEVKLDNTVPPSFSI